MDPALIVVRAWKGHEPCGNQLQILPSSTVTAAPHVRVATQLTGLPGEEPSARAHVFTTQYTSSRAVNCIALAIVHCDACVDVLWNSKTSIADIALGPGQLVGGAEYFVCFEGPRYGNVSQMGKWMFCPRCLAIATLYDVAAYGRP